MQFKENWKAPKNKSEEVDALSKEVDSFHAFVEQEIKMMKADPDQIESTYNKIRGEYETKTIDSENKDAFDLQMSRLDGWISSYRQKHEEFLSERNESIKLMNGELLSHVNYAIQKIKYLDEDRTISDRLMENKKGLWELLVISESVTPENFNLEETVLNLSEIRELCDFDFNINPEELSPEQADYARYFANEAANSLAYLVDGLTKVSLSFDKINVEGYNEVAIAFKKLSELAYGASLNLQGMSRKLEY
jgi:hypothetical protein